MNNVVWHKIEDNDYPHIFKDVLLLYESGTLILGFYRGKTIDLPWFSYCLGTAIKGDNIIAWCDLPEIPDDLGVKK